MADEGIISMSVKERETLALHERSPNMPFLNVDSKFETLRVHPRFQHLIEKIGLFARPK